MRSLDDGAMANARVTRRAFLSAAAFGAAALALPARAQPGRLRLLKLRHSSFLVELEGGRVLIDPCFSRDLGLSPLVRAAPVSLAPEDVGALDLVLVTSGHFDHFDGYGVRRLPERGALCLVPDERLASRMRSAGFPRVRTVRPGDRLFAGGVRVDVSPSEDPLAILPAVGYRLERAGRSVWHTGAPPPLEVSPAPAVFARAFASEVVLACANGTSAFGRKLGMPLDDGVLLGALCRARLVIPQHDGAEPMRLFAPFVSHAERGAPLVPGAPRVFVLEPGVWYRVSTSLAGPRLGERPASSPDQVRSGARRAGRTGHRR